MRIVLASGTPYLPQVRGGVEVNTHEIATELLARGHEVSVLTRLSYRDAFGLRARIAQGLSAAGCRDDSLGYAVYRARNPSALVPDMLRPDVVVIQNGNPWPVTTAFAERGVPSLVYLHGLGFDSWPRQSAATGGDRIPASGYLSISDFVKRRFAAKHGIPTRVIPPIHQRERYVAERREPAYATLINPVAVKGVDLAIEVAARCPEIPFCFVKGWPLGLRGRRRLKARLAQLSNVTFRENVAMPTVYGWTRILLVPSQWEAETWGRVATEAQYNGIPVLATDRGGLPESVGPGGSIFPVNASPDLWAAELRRLWSDPEAYREKSEAATAYSTRRAIDVEAQIESLEEILSQTAKIPQRGLYQPDRVFEGGLLTV
ncbi:glycosyltransferase [Methylobacterium trifolii]|uniref:D-inositol-3-phosphate glycosyltransferase n=1 Tax=Methylobacterium trifolii TaxID=1003092 RepID=A0ABQ4U856_9HYPH|nr:glycosyltransferase [Methylobacterium trifolii]GJE62602.1 D-inositol-3-phosphate glycosyltransferase [Methylobacterium trifolii]